MLDSNHHMALISQILRENVDIFPTLRNFLMDVITFPEKL